MTQTAPLGAPFFFTLYKAVAARRAPTETWAMNKSTDPEALRTHWRRNRLLTGGLLLLWFTLVMGTALFAREINKFTLFGVPLAFYIFAQGAPILFLIIIGIHARLMNRLDRRQPTARRHDSA